MIVFLLLRDGLCSLQCHLSGSIVAKARKFPKSYRGKVGEGEGGTNFSDTRSNENNWVFRSVQLAARTQLTKRVRLGRSDGIFSSSTTTLHFFPESQHVHLFHEYEPREGSDLPPPRKDLIGPRIPPIRQERDARGKDGRHYQASREG
ncbi:hypothetical protein T439DRAFT_131141 [Meredithblackwellia eburnea MCA 4105]